MRISLSALTSIALCAVLQAQPRLGVEIPLSPNSPMQAAFGAQTWPDVATDGNAFLAVWNDDRALARGETFVSRLEPDGTPADLFGRNLGAFDNARVASNGNSYVVAASNGSDLHIQHVDVDGAPAGDAHVIPERRATHLASNGSTYLLITSDVSGRIPEPRRATILIGDGLPWRELPQALEEVFAVASRQDSYYLLESRSTFRSDGELSSAILQPVTESGELLEAHVLPLGLLGSQQFVGAFSPGAILIGWGNGTYAGYVLASYDGGTPKPFTLPFANAAPTAAAWDGKQFLLTFTDRAVRISADGTLIDQTPFALRVGDAPRFASNSRGGVVVWSDDHFSTGGDIESRSFTSFDDLAQQAAAATLVSWSGPPAIAPQITRTTEHELAVWLDPAASRLSGTLDGRALAIAAGTPFAASVAAGMRTFLVSWYDLEAQTLLAKRIDAGGVIDAQPITLAAGLLPVEGEPPAVAFDGSAYLVIWPQAGLIGRRITEDGLVADPVVAAASINPFLHSPRLLFTASGYFLAYSASFECGVVNTCYPSSSIFGLPLDASSATSHELFANIFVSAPVDAAVSDDRVTYAWRQAGYPATTIMTGQSTLDGTLLSFGHPIASVALRERCGFPFLAGPRVLWNGSEIVLAWTEGNGCDQFSSTRRTVRAIRLSRTLEPLDSEPFDVAADVTGDAPSLALSSDGVRIAYSRFDDANGRAPRAFTRTLARSEPPPPRRRGVRH